MPSRLVLEISAADPPGGGPDQRFEEVIANFSSPAVAVQTGKVQSGDVLRFRCSRQLMPVDFEVVPASGGALPVHPDSFEEIVKGKGGISRLLQVRHVSAKRQFAVVFRTLVDGRPDLTSDPVVIVVDPR